MRPRVLRTSLCACALAAATVACVPLEKPHDQGASSGVRPTLTPALRPGAGYLCPAFGNGDLNNRMINGKDDAIVTELIDLSRNDGSQLLLVMGRRDNPPSAYGTDNGWQITFLCPGLVSPHKGAVELTVAEDFSPPPGIGHVMTVDLPSGSLIAWCPIPTPMTPKDALPEALWWKAGTSQFASSSVEVRCDVRALGAGISGADFFALRAGSTPQQVEVQRHAMNAEGNWVASGQVRHLGLPAQVSFSRIWWTAELAPDVFAWVTSTADGLQYFRSDVAAAVNLPGQRTLKFVHRDPATGGFVLVGDHYELWNAEGTGQLTASMPLPGPPASSSAWGVSPSGLAFSQKTEPNPEAIHLTIPVTSTLAEPGAAEYTVREVPTTPCVTQKACRGAGEHYLLGAVSVGGAPHGLYFSWPWMLSSYAEILVAPLQ